MKKDAKISSGNRMLARYICMLKKFDGPQGEEEKRAIEEEMGADPGAASILESLRATRASAKDRQTKLERSIREEARKLKGDGEGARRGK